MKIYVLMHHYEDDPSLMPNAIAIYDEYLMDSAGSDYWEAEKAEAMEKMGPGTFREVILEVPDAAMTGLFGEPPTVAATVVGK